MANWFGPNVLGDKISQRPRRRSASIHDHTVSNSSTVGTTDKPHTHTHTKTHARNSPYRLTRSAMKLGTDKSSSQPSTYHLVRHLCDVVIIKCLCSLISDRYYYVGCVIYTVRWSQDGYTSIMIYLRHHHVYRQIRYNLKQISIYKYCILDVCRYL